MIYHGAKRADLGDIRSPIQIIQDSDERFILIGSRRHGGATHASDYNFLAMKSPEVEKFLRDHGFVYNNDDRRNSNFSMVYIRGNVSVLVSTVADIHEHVHNWFDKNPKAYRNFRVLTPSTQMVVWNYLVSFVTDENEPNGV